MTAVEPGTLVHDAYLYSSQDELVERCTPYLREGLERSEHVFCAVLGSNLDALRESLGTDAAGVDFCPSETWYRRPAETLRGYVRYVRGAAPAAVRVVGEVAWPDRSAAGVREWTRYESMLNVVFVGARASIVCPYDTRALPDRVLDHVLHTHTGAWTNGHSAPSAHYVEHATLGPRLDAEPLEPPAGEVTTVPIGTAADARSFARAQATRAGLDAERTSDLVLAVSEVAANGIQHGGPPVCGRAWIAGGRLVCEIEDAGGGFDDPLVGYLPPGPIAGGGRGLWLARMLTDLVEVRSKPGATAVRIHVRLEHAAPH